MSYKIVMPLLCAALLLNSFAGEKSAPVTAPPDEFVYEGRTAAQWAADLKAEGPTGKNGEKARRALRALGKDAVPVLMNWLINEKDPALRAEASELLSSMKHSRDSVPAFMALFKDGDIDARRTAAKLLSEMKLGQDGIPLFMNWLKDSDYDVRRTAVRSLSEFGSGNAEVFTALKTMREDRDKAVAEAAVEAFDTSVRISTSAQEKYVVDARSSLASGQTERVSALLKQLQALPNLSAKTQEELRVLEDELRTRQGEGAARAQDQARANDANARLKEAEQALTSGKFEDAVKLADLARQTAPTDPHVRKAADALCKRSDLAITYLKNAELAMENGNFERAFKLAQETLLVVPNNAPANEIIAEARKELKKVLEKDPRPETKKKAEANPFD